MKGYYPLRSSVKASPYTRKARVVLAEKRIDYEFIVEVPYAAATPVHRRGCGV